MRNPLTVGPDTLARLSRTRPDGQDLALFAAGLHSRRLVLLKSLQRRMESGAVPPQQRAAFVRDWRVLEDAERRDPAAARAVLGYPSVGIWLVEALEAPDSRAARVLAHFGTVAAAAALGARSGYRGTLETPDGILALPGIGVYRTRAPRVRLVAGPRSARLALEDGRTGAVLPLGRGATDRRPRGRGPYGAVSGRPYGPPRGRPLGRPSLAASPGWSGIVPLPGTAAVLDGIDPYRLPSFDSGLFGLVPPRRTPRAGAGEGPWLRRWRAALALLTSADPARAAEVTGLTRAVVPLEPGFGAAASATLRAAPGAVFTTYPTTALRMAEVLVHEVQHGKLAVVTDLVALHEGDEEPVHRVGWRPDPRPLAAVIQGTYAHLGLADLAYRMAERPGATPAARRVARLRGEECREQVADALDDLLRSGQLTPVGRKFAVGMREHHAELGRIGATGERTARRDLPIRTFR